MTTRLTGQGPADDGVLDATERARTGPRPGDVLAGRYRVQRLIGQGARKVVHLAHDVELDRPVAVCALRPDRSTDEERSRLRREATVLARVGDAPCVVAVHDVLEQPGGPLVLCQYLPGGSLEERLREGPLPVREALETAADIATALAQAHALGIVHRDVKPANVWRTATGRAVLGDFGLAVPVGQASEGGLVGSPSYMAPEQALGAPAQPASDLYSLGALLHAAICGRPPFDLAGLLDTVDALLHAEAVPPSQCADDVPPGVDDLVLRLLAKEPADRPPSAQAVLDELRRLLGGSPAPAVPGAGAFVGRAQEMSQLGTALAEAAAGQGGLTLLVGEPGTGKTRTGLELVRSAAADGWLVLPARCHEGDGSPSYWPWTQVLRSAAREVGRDALRTAAGDQVPLLAAVLPDLGPAPDLSAGRLDAESARFPLFDGVARVLCALATTRPVLVAVDDVHWADAASLALTAFLGREVAGSPIAVLACCREGEEHPLDVLGRAAVRTVRLGGLPLDETGAFLRSSVGVDPSDRLVARLHAHTDGNPYFLAEVVRLLAAEQRLDDVDALLAGDLPVPGGVREVLRRRLRLVPPACADLLATASVLGRDVPVDVLRAVVDAEGGDGSHVVALLDEAVRARLVTQQAAAVPVRYRFAHALVHEVLYADLSAVDRMRLHRRAGEVLAAVRESRQHGHAAEVAAHFVRAAPAGDVAPAVAWSIRAARAATAAGASEDAVTHWSCAVALSGQAVGDAALPDPVELLLELGEAQCRDGDTGAGRESFLRAAEQALVRGDAALLARAALGYGVGLGGFGFVEHADGELLSLLEESLAMLPATDDPLRVRVLARLATELYFTPFRSRRLETSRQAVEMAARLDDPQVLMVAVYSRALALLGPRSTEELRRTADRVVRLATAAQDTGMAFRGHVLRLAVALETGSPDEVRSDVEACRRIAEQDPAPLHVWQAEVQDAMLALLAGRFDDARRLADAALDLGRRGHAEMALVMYGAQLLTVSWAQGRLDDVVDAVRGFADRYPHAPAWRAALAFCYLELGREREAQAQLDLLAERDFDGLPDDGNWLTATSLLALVAGRVGDQPRAERLRAMLLPYAGRSVVMAAGAVAAFSVHLPLGVLAGALGEHDEALHHLALAQRTHDERGAPMLQVWTADEEVRVLRRRGLPTDLDRARAVVDDALPLAQRLGMRDIATRLAAARAAIASGGEVAPGEVMSVVLTDVAGSTELTERLGEAVVHDVLLQWRAHVADVAAAHGGRLLKRLGDGVLLAFDDAGRAVRCAVALHRCPSNGPHRLQLRTAVHTGSVLREGESMYGRTMILAFRLADRARAGEVLVSGATRDAVAGLDDVRCGPGRRLRLKGIRESERVHRLLLDGDDGA